MDDRDLDGEAPHLAKGAALGLLYAQQHGYDFRYVPPRARGANVRCILANLRCILAYFR